MVRLFFVPVLRDADSNLQVNGELLFSLENIQLVPAGDTGVPAAVSHLPDRSRRCFPGSQAADRRSSPRQIPGFRSPGRSVSAQS